VVGVTARARTVRWWADDDDGDSPPPWGQRQLVVPTDGPLAGRWYLAEDWQVAHLAAERTAQARTAAGHEPADVLGYVETSEQVQHPTELAVGTAWRFDLAGQHLARQHGAEGGGSQ
jgi:hypothetical protein